MSFTNTTTYWEQRYQDGNTRWDLGQPAPPLVDWLQTHSTPPGRTIVLGCGRGHDAVLFAQQGFTVTAVDFAPSAIAAAQELAHQHQVSLQLLQRDIFQLVPEFAGCFDYVVEHTCFCALPPTLRPQYVNLVRSLLKPRGQLVGVFFTHDRPDGPPFGATAEDLRHHFEPDFIINSLEPVQRSSPQRQGEEHVGIFSSRDDQPGV